jgi:hypothetical protein
MSGTRTRFRSHRRPVLAGPAGVIAMIAGSLLVGWIVVQLAVIRTFSWLQPVMAAAGVVVLLSGLRVAGRRS